MSFEEGYSIYHIFIIGFLLFVIGFSYGINNEYMVSLVYWITILIALIVVRVTKLRRKKK